MKKLLVWSAASLAALGLFVSACAKDGARGNAYDKSPVLATVNGEAISVDDFKAEAEGLAPYVLQSLADEEARRKFLDSLISKKLLVQQAEKEGLDRDPELVRRLDQTRANLLLGLYVRQEVFEKATVTDDEVRQYFENNKDKLGSVRISHIQVGSADEAEDVLIKYKAGESFNSLAKKYSRDKETSNKGGDLGFLDWSQFGSSDLRKAAFNTPLGDVSNVIRSSFAFHIIKVTDKKPARDEDFDKLKDLLKEDLAEKRREELFNSKVEALKTAAEIKPNEPAIKELSLQGLARPELPQAPASAAAPAAEK